MAESLGGRRIKELLGFVQSTVLYQFSDLHFSIHSPVKSLHIIYYS